MVPAIIRLTQIATDPPDPNRVILSQYHAVGAVSAGYMLRKGQWKLNTYIGFEPELFNLQNDPVESPNLAADPVLAELGGDLTAERRVRVDPGCANAQVVADQAAVMEKYGGPKAALDLCGRGATPRPAR